MRRLAGRLTHAGRAEALPFADRQKQLLLICQTRVSATRLARSTGHHNRVLRDTRSAGGR